MIADRSPVVRLGVRAATPLAVLVAVFLFFAGHNRPGGGFAAGLVLGAAVALRTIAGIQKRSSGVSMLALGGLIVAVTGLAPLATGRAILDMAVVEVSTPLLGTIKSGSAVVFDAGVTLIVVGLVMAVLDGLGAVALGGEQGTGGDRS